MATTITEECINCGACEPECPNGAISQGEDIYIIDPKLCTECVGFHDEEACAAVCPVDCCIPDPNNLETEEQLHARLSTIHPDKSFPPLAEMPRAPRWRAGTLPPLGRSGSTTSPRFVYRSCGWAGSGRVPCCASSGPAVPTIPGAALGRAGRIPLRTPSSRASRRAAPEEARNRWARPAAVSSWRGCC